MANRAVLTLCVILISLLSLAAGGWTIGRPDGGGRGAFRRVYQGARRAGGGGLGYLQRSKREWKPPPFNILENLPEPYPRNIDRIVSDAQQNHTVYYKISGPGVDLGYFTLDQQNGMLKVWKTIDREEFPSFAMKVQAIDSFTHLERDKHIIIEVIVDDVNDNAPQFKDPLQFKVPERSPVGQVVGVVNATDRDQKGTSHVDISFTLLTGQDLFAIHPKEGTLTTKTNTLDRETKDKHTVMVEIRDMNGASSGKFTTAPATITLTDINDNPPTFTKTSYNASISENVKDKLILRIPVQDKDLQNTPNWISKFVISKGNEAANFRMETDPTTNDGLLYVTKALDYEKNKNVNLEITAQNVAPLKGTTLTWLSVPVKVAVTDVDEGPEFTAPTVRYKVKENTPNGSLIGTYTAMDPETKSSNGITYYKTFDPAGWVNMDLVTGELRVANTIDRESHFVENGMYNLTVKAVDASSKTGTGTVIIVVEDENDNVPTLPPGDLIICEKEGQHGSVLLVAEDKDQSPFSDPFTFSVPADSDGKWTVTRVNDTAASLQHVMDLPTGIYQVPVHISDLQGNGKVQTAQVRICECRGGVCLAKDRSAVFGGFGVLAMLLPLLLLLLLGVLLALFCATKREKIALDDAGDSGGILLKSNTEAPGDEVDSSLINVPLGAEAVKGSVKGTLLNSGWVGNKSGSTIGGQSLHENGLYKGGISTTNMNEFYSSQYEGQQFGGQALGTGMGFDYRHVAQDSAFLHTWQTNRRYLHQKLGYLGGEDNGRWADDILHAYGYEGVGSAAGSVGCCSEYDDTDNLEFLNTLGPKFNTLADCCRKT